MQFLIQDFYCNVKTRSFSCLLFLFSIIYWVSWRYCNYVLSGQIFRITLHCKYNLRDISYSVLNEVKCIPFYLRYYIYNTKGLEYIICLSLLSTLVHLHHAIHSSKRNRNINFQAFLLTACFNPIHLLWMMRVLKSFFVVRCYKIIIVYHKRKRLHYCICIMVFLPINLVLIFIVVRRNNGISVREICRNTKDVYAKAERCGKPRWDCRGFNVIIPCKIRRNLANKWCEEMIWRKILQLKFKILKINFFNRRSHF